MPNHVSHLMIFENEAAVALLMEMKVSAKHEAHNPVDFCYFIPVPDDVGILTEYHGTKWNAYSQSDILDHEGKKAIRFDTAWSTATPVWEKIAEDYPEVDITIYYSDEDAGNNLGIITISAGRVDIDERSGSTNEEKMEIISLTQGEFYVICEGCGNITYIDEHEGCWYCTNEADDKGGLW